MSESGNLENAGAVGDGAVEDGAKGLESLPEEMQMFVPASKSGDSAPKKPSISELAAQAEKAFVSCVETLSNLPIEYRLEFYTRLVKSLGGKRVEFNKVVDSYLKELQSDVDTAFLALEAEVAAKNGKTGKVGRLEYYHEFIVKAVSIGATHGQIAEKLTVLDASRQAKMSAEGCTYRAYKFNDQAIKEYVIAKIDAGSSKEAGKASKKKSA